MNAKCNSWVRDTIQEMELDQLIEFAPNKHLCLLDRDSALRDAVIDLFFSYESVESPTARTLLTSSFWGLDWCELGDYVDTCLADYSDILREDTPPVRLDVSFSWYAAEAFGPYDPDPGPYNGLKAGDEVELVDIDGNVNTVITNCVVRNFSVAGLYCWYTCYNTATSETAVYMAYSVRKKFSCDSQRYTLRLKQE